MDSPINPNSQDLEDIERDLSKEDSKRKFYIVFTALMIAFCIIVIGVVIIVLTRNKNKEEESNEPKQDEPIEPKWEELPDNEVYENFECQENETLIIID